MREMLAIIGHEVRYVITCWKQMQILNIMTLGEELEQLLEPVEHGGCLSQERWAVCLSNIHHGVAQFGVVLTFKLVWT